MKNPDALKGRILAAATELIEQGSGNITEINTRAIAEKANVATGLINYHFQSKDNLVTLCVQRIVSRVVNSFAPEEKAYPTDQVRLTDWASRVFEFLFANPAISRISILGDLAEYGADSNSTHTRLGFMHALRADVPEENHALLAFVLTTAMQAAFLSAKTGTPGLGCDFVTPEGRAAFIARLVSMLFNGAAQTTVKENHL